LVGSQWDQEQPWEQPWQRTWPTNEHWSKSNVVYLASVCGTEVSLTKLWLFS
jgi:hypothetical protein